MSTDLISFKIIYIHDHLFNTRKKRTYKNFILKWQRIYFYCEEHSYTFLHIVFLLIRLFFFKYEVSTRKFIVIKFCVTWGNSIIWKY